MQTNDKNKWINVGRSDLFGSSDKNDVRPILLNAGLIPHTNWHLGSGLANALHKERVGFVCKVDRNKNK